MYDLATVTLSIGNENAHVWRVTRVEDWGQGMRDAEFVGEGTDADTPSIFPSLPIPDRTFEKRQEECGERREQMGEQS